MFEETLSVDAVLAGSVDPSVKGHWPPHLDRELPECKTALTSRYWLRTGDSWHFRMTSCDIHSCVSGSVWLTQSFAAAICLRFRCGSACVCARACVSLWKRNVGVVWVSVPLCLSVVHHRSQTPAQRWDPPLPPLMLLLHFAFPLYCFNMFFIILQLFKPTSPHSLPAQWATAVILLR